MSSFKNFFKGMFYLVFVNILILTTAIALTTFLMKVFNVQGEWTLYFILYSIIGFAGAFISLFLSRYFAKSMMGVRVIDPRAAQGKERDLVDMVHQMASHARLPAKPEVGIFENPQPNAFATGPSKKKSLVAVSTGLLNSMNKNELEGVIAHEVAHIANGDMLLMTLLQGLINTMVLLAARFVAKIIVSRMKRQSFWLEYGIFIGLQIAFSVLGSIVLCYFSRKREFRADKGGAKLAGVDNMILALKALQRLTAVPAMQTAGAGRRTRAESFNYLQISGKTKNKTSIFSTHPPLSLRIARLEKRSYS